MIVDSGDPSGARQAGARVPPNTSRGSSPHSSPQGVQEAGRGPHIIWQHLLWLLIALHSEMKRL